MNTLLESMGLLCLAIQNSGDNDVGRTKLQKMVYFADRYLGWDVGDYDLHYYGPYSRNLATTLKTVRGELIDETRPGFGSYQYDLTQSGTTFVDEFVENVCDDEKTRLTRELFTELSVWSKDNLELAATIDYVKNNIPDISRDDLLAKVGIIKENFAPEQIEHAYELWSNWKQQHNF
ncbi:hypothetical protein NsoK4_08235 [Nitrosopumilus sp. K4]|uniref:hypothetical protein n=1 Tax=Nitrosopumilus sp. K4 TaxID=2795383 RepID=UPI001BA4F38C|nr:hypothetical protein [Nitrosopumilus sp. K4]QUC64403.1 hypothetical protein NsoK4_08235 [Nitrosopumilus sp. K4]